MTPSIRRFLAAAALPLLASTASGRDPQAARRDYDQGLAAYKTGDLAEAEELLSKAIGEDPSLRIAFAARAQARHALGQVQTLREDIDKAVSIRPGDAEEYVARGN